MTSLEKNILTIILQMAKQSKTKIEFGLCPRWVPELAIKTIQDLLNIHIDRYVFDQYEEAGSVVDKVGGI